MFSYPYSILLLLYLWIYHTMSVAIEALTAKRWEKYWWLFPQAVSLALFGIMKTSQQGGSFLVIFRFISQNPLTKFMRNLQQQGYTIKLCLFSKSNKLACVIWGRDIYGTPLAINCREAFHNWSLSFYLLI